MRRSAFEHLHKLIMGTGVGERTESALGGLWLTVPVALISRMACGLTTLLAARWLGPTQFGEANVALATTLWIQIPLLLGLPTALMHYIPQMTETEKPLWISDGFKLSLVCGVLTLTIGWMFRSVWAHLQGVPVFSFELGLLWSAGFGCYTVVTSMFSALENFRAKAWSEFAFTLFFCSLILGAWRFSYLNGTVYVLALTIAYGVIGLAGGAASASCHFRRGGGWEASHRLLTYGLLASLGSVVHALFNSPARFVANRFLTLPEVGVLSVYQGGSVQMAFFLLTVGTQVFFPIASRTPDKRTLLSKINRLLILGSPFALLLFGAMLVLYFLALGKQYPLRAPEVILFSLAAALTMVYGCLAWHFTSSGRRGVVVSSLIGLCAGAVNAGACLSLIPHWNIAGAGLANVLGAMTGILAYYSPALQRTAGLLAQKTS